MTKQSLIEALQTNVDNYEKTIAAGEDRDGDLARVVALYKEEIEKLKAE
jgi:hypothetical protein